MLEHRIISEAALSKNCPTTEPWEIKTGEPAKGNHGNATGKTSSVGSSAGHAAQVLQQINYKEKKKSSEFIA